MVKYSSQPQAKKIPKRFIANTDQKDGDVISYQLLSGDYILLKVILIIEEWTGDRYTLFEICDWRGKVIPTKEYISRLQLKEWIWENGDRELIKLVVYQAVKRDDPSNRIKKVAEKIDAILDKDPPHRLITWKELDKKLEQFYQLK
ncbi:hypothetical protein [Gottfriedia acidiceleris]|uniref:hypothetical protein n=1 Tax=Gottfriedia acidiceleris TaxID=371036 RepID=UPI000B446CF8|nr:hypothetical protein [Gottfriedia acidiceleris]